MEESINGDVSVLAEIENLYGFTLGDVLKIVQQKGYTAEKIIITSPPKLDISEYDDSFRVLRIQPLEGKRLAILVCKPL